MASSKEQKPNPSKAKNPVLSLTVPCECMYDPTAGGGAIGMTINDCAVMVRQGGEQVVEILPALGGGIVLHDQRTGKSWSINMLDIAKAFIRDANIEREHEAVKQLMGRKPKKGV